MSIVTTVLVMFSGRKSYYQVTAGVVSKLYSNTLLASLNGRIEAAMGMQELSFDAHLSDVPLSFDFPTIQKRQAAMATIS